MSLFKIANAVIEQEITSANHRDGQGFIWDFEKKPGMMYFISRGVSANVPNGNGDYFSADELRKSYKTFVGKGLFLNHASNDIEKQRGKIVDAKLVDKNPNDIYVNCLVEFNAEAFPELASMIRHKQITDVSMGCTVAYSSCSICHHKSPTTKTYCDHIRNHKGSVYGMQRVYEINHDVEFIELSLVTRGADSTAKILEVVARQYGFDYNEVLSKVASFDDKKEFDKIHQYENYSNELKDIIIKSIQKANVKREGF